MTALTWGRRDMKYKVHMTANSAVSCGHMVTDDTPR